MAVTPKLAFALLPAECWDRITGCLEDTEDKLNLAQSCKQMFNFFKEHFSGWAMAKAIFLPTFLAEMEDNEPRFMALRECNRDTKIAIDKHLMEIRKLKHWHLSLETPLPTTINEWKSTLIPLKYHTRYDEEAACFVVLGDTFLETPDQMLKWLNDNHNRPHWSNPFPAKSILLRFDDTLTAEKDLEHQDEEHYIHKQYLKENYARGLDANLQLVTRFGHQLHSLKLNMAEFVNENSFQDCWNNTAQLLQLVPNLKELVFHTEVVFASEYDHAVPLPPKQIDTVALTGEHSPLTTALFQAYAPGAKRLIVDVQIFQQGVIHGESPSFEARELIIIDSTRLFLNQYHNNLLQQFSQCTIPNVVRLSMEWRTSKPSFFLQLLQLPYFTGLQYLELTPHPLPCNFVAEMVELDWETKASIQHLIIPFVPQLHYEFWLVKFEVLKELSLNCKDRTIPEDRVRQFQIYAPSFKNLVQSGLLHIHFFWDFMPRLETVRVEWNDGVDNYERQLPGAPRRIN